MKGRSAFAIAWILFSAVICLALVTQGCMMRNVTVRQCKDVKNIFTSHVHAGGHK